MITIEGHHATAEVDLRAGLDDLQTLLKTYVPGVTLKADLLTPDHPAFSD